MKHYAEKSRAPLPPRRKCPTPAGKQVTLLPPLADLPAVSLLLPSPAGLAAGPPLTPRLPPARGGQTVRRGGESWSLRSRISQLDGGLYPWKQTKRTTRPLFVPASCKEKRTGRLGPDPCAAGFLQRVPLTVPKLLVGLEAACFAGFTSAHPGVSGMCGSETQVSSLPLPSFPEEEPLPPLQRCGQWPWGHSGALGLTSREGLVTFLCFPRH